MAARRPPAVARVIERITKTARAHDLFAPGDLVLLWVSGGPDSVCLLESMVRLRRLFRIRLAVFHMDHRLRPDSATDAAYVRRLAYRHGLPFHLAVAVDEPGRSDSVEMWGRFERAREAGKVALAIGASRMADGHTLDDQAETILMGLVLGWGLDGMGGIAPVNGTLVRPLLDVTRTEVEAFCRALHLRPRSDPTNADTNLLRNALRREAIPAIERSTGRDVKRTFARTADHLRRDAAALFAHADEHAQALVELREHGFAIRARPLLDLPPALSSRVARRGFQRADLAWDHEAIEAVLDLAAGSPGRTRDLLLGIKARRTRTHVEVEG
ncbi:MAG: tRNA lysidine(34) synthetase TilS [Actinobacteria bacterium]|nr:MAG: tRNA lysidine(34) synthetase TilS [Actinomycetota bacterium]